MAERIWLLQAVKTDGEFYVVVSDEPELLLKTTRGYKTDKYNHGFIVTIFNCIFA